MTSQPTKNGVRVDAVKLVDDLLNKAIDEKASDLHVEPVSNGFEIRFRRDGLLETVATLDATTGGAAVNRLMVMAQLLTYRLDVPQEGRITFEAKSIDHPLDLRLAMIPTVHGLRAAVRLPAELTQPQTLRELGLPEDVVKGLEDFARTDSGMLIVTGPAGSGKTTTIYALLQHITQVQPGLSIVSLEDPVERQVAGITQIEVKPFGELTYERALRSILRQDPQVLMLGEIRDVDTARLAVQAAMSGHRLICTLHAATPIGAISRLIDMGIEPYRIAGCVWGVISQRLVRRLAPSPSTLGEGWGEGQPLSGDRCGENMKPSPQPSPCVQGEGVSKYTGRLPVAQWLRISDELRSAIARQADSSELTQRWAKGPDHRTLRDAADDLIKAGLTDLAEVQRVLGTD